MKNVKTNFNKIKSFHIFKFNPYRFLDKNNVLDIPTKIVENNDDFYQYMNKRD